jgi:acetolactate decarboxylase
MRATIILVSTVLISILFFATSFTTVKHPSTAYNSHTDTTHNHLFTVGIGAGLIGGLYDGYYPYKSLKQHGNFGLGAPDKLDGELVIFNGKAYQTQHTGKTFVVEDKQLTSFAMVNFFKADKKFTPGYAMNKTELFHYLDSILTNVNGLYAIHINGQFSYIKTRAFPPVKEHDHTPLAAMLPLQHFFEFNNAQGDLIGYRLPSFMDNTNISGYHFHFLSTQKTAGGHIIDLKAENITIEIDQLNSYEIQVPATSDFEQFDFKKTKGDDIKSVERGK